MASAVVIITLLTVAASLASWLFGQWLASRTRISAAALAVGGGGAVLLISAVAFVIVGASSGWQHWIPVEDFSPSANPAATARSTDAWPVKLQPAEVAESTRHDDPVAGADQLRMSERKAELLASAESDLEQSRYKQAIDTAREYLAVFPHDADMLSMMARSLFAAQHPGSASILPAAVVTEWPATDCVESKRSEESARWMLDNGCGRVVAVLFASCERSECFTNTSVSMGWRYELTGILMTAANDRPVPVRLGDHGPLVAPIFTIRDAGNARRQIRYLACEVTAPGVLQVLHESGGDLTQQQLAAELRADACYTQVLAWSSSGQRSGASPDLLLRNGID